MMLMIKSIVARTGKQSYSIFHNDTHSNKITKHAITHIWQEHSHAQVQQYNRKMYSYDKTSTNDS